MKIQHLELVNGVPTWVKTGYKDLATARRLNPSEIPNFFRVKR